MATDVGIMEQYQCEDCDQDFWVSGEVDDEVAYCPYCGGQGIVFQALYEATLQSV